MTPIWRGLGGGFGITYSSIDRNCFEQGATVLARNLKSLLRYGVYSVFLRIVLGFWAKTVAPCQKQLHPDES